MDKSALDAFTEDIICQICYDELEDPRVLPCHHYFCAHCISSSLDKVTQIFTCPTCNSRTSRAQKQLPVAFMVYRLITKVHKYRELYTTTPTTHCLEHECPFKLMCLDCSILACPECILTTHKKHRYEYLSSKPNMSSPSQPTLTAPSPSPPLSSATIPLELLQVSYSDTLPQPPASDTTAMPFPLKASIAAPSLPEPGTYPPPPSSLNRNMTSNNATISLPAKQSKDAPPPNSATPPPNSATPPPNSATPLPNSATPPSNGAISQTALAVLMPTTPPPIPPKVRSATPPPLPRKDFAPSLSSASKGVAPPQPPPHLPRRVSSLKLPTTSGFTDSSFQGDLFVTAPPPLPIKDSIPSLSAASDSTSEDSAIFGWIHEGVLFTTPPPPLPRKVTSPLLSTSTTSASVQGSAAAVKEYKVHMLMQTWYCQIYKPQATELLNGKMDGTFLCRPILRSCKKVFLEGDKHTHTIDVSAQKRVFHVQIDEYQKKYSLHSGNIKSRVHFDSLMELVIYYAENPINLRPVYVTLKYPVHAMLK